MFPQLDRVALRDTLATMDAAVSGASPELRAELQPQLDERRAHVTQKLAQLDQVAGTLADARNWMGTLRDTLAGQVRAGRTTLQWADPGLAWTFVGTGVVLDGFAYGVLNTASVSPPPDGSAPALGASLSGHQRTAERLTARGSATLEDA